MEIGGDGMMDDIIVQYFKTPAIQPPSPICFLVFLPDDVDDARDNLKDKPSVIFRMAAYQTKIIALAYLLKREDHAAYFLELRRYEAMMRDKLKDTIPFYERVDRALCIYALDSLIRWKSEV
jgi:hypothetical protein